MKTVEQAHERAKNELICLNKLAELSGISPAKIYQLLREGSVLPVLKGAPMLFTKRQADELAKKGGTSPTDEEFGLYFTPADAAEYLGVGLAAFRMQAFNYGNVAYVVIHTAKGGKAKSVFVRPELERLKSAGLMRGLGGSGAGRPAKSKPARNELAEQIVLWLSQKRKEVIGNIAKEFASASYGEVETALAHLVSVKKVKEGQKGLYSVLKQA